VREVNRGRSPANRLRVLLADPAIEWATIRDRMTWEQIARTRDQHAFDVIEHEVLGRGRHALLVFGSAHVERERAFDHGKPDRPRPPNLEELLDARHPGATLYITADWANDQVDAALARSRPPVVVRLTG